MFEVLNTTPFSVGTFVVPDADGADTLLVVAKATFDARDGDVRVAPEQRPITLADEYWGEPGQSSLKYASDVHLGKPATDVAVIGAAHAPLGRPTAQFMFSVSVGALWKALHVVGERTLTVFGDMTAPAPVTTVPLRYEHAYGGSHVSPGGGSVCVARNPVGRGFRGKRGRREMAGRPLPNLLDPRQARDVPSDAMQPAAVGFVAPSWEPRRALAGTYDDRWRIDRAPFLPTDFDPRFFQAASAGLVIEGRLEGGEPVEIVNGAPPPHARQRYPLPHCVVRADVRIGGRRERPPMVMDTLLIEPERVAFSMVWRGALRCHDRATRIEQIKIDLMGLRGARS